MKKFVTLFLVAVLAVSCICVLAACNKPLEEEGAYYILAGGQPGWGLDAGVAPTDEDVAPRLLEAIAKNDARVKSIKKELKGAKYLYLIEYKFEGEAGWTNDFVMKEGEDSQAIDGNCLVKVIRYTESEEAKGTWTPIWYSSPEAGNVVKSLTPDTLWMPQFKEEPEDGTSGWNSNGVLLKGVGTYYIVFVAFQDGTFGMAAIAK